jgi:hypothetical protein
MIVAIALRLPERSDDDETANACRVSISVTRLMVQSRLIHTPRSRALFELGEERREFVIQKIGDQELS